MHSIIIPTIVSPLGVILGLLVTWRRHRHKQDAGVTTYSDIFNPSGIHFHMYVVPESPDLCIACRETNRSIRPAQDTPTSSCKTPDICLGTWLSFSGGWLEANRVIAELRSQKMGRERTLTPTEVAQFIETEWNLEPGHPDRPHLHWIAGLSHERTRPPEAILSLTAVLKEATLPHHWPLLVPAYLRLAGLLARRGDPMKALDVITHCEKRYAKAEIGTLTLTGKQRRALAAMKPYLYALAESNTMPMKKPAQLEEC